MNYSLGNTLSRGGSLNADGLSLDLQFATDKTLTARKGPTPTFTRASTATFVGSNGLIQSAAINGARFDHDPVTLACKGLLIEESRTNVMLRSQDFSNVVWLKSNSTISGTLYTDPSGASTANELVEDILSAGHTCTQTAGTSTIGITYTFSVFVKRKDTSNQFIIIGATGLVSAAFMSVNLTNGVTATGIGSPVAPINVSSTAYPNGWYRVQFSVVATSAAAITLDIRLSRDGTWATRSYLGDGVQSSLIWGAQVEAGSFPTSYIPTASASVVRSADVCSITGADFTGMYNQSEGTMLVNAFTPANGDRTIFAADDNTANEMIRLRTEGTNPFFKVSDGGVELVAIDSGTVVANTNFKLAGAYKLNDFASSINGGAAVTDTSGTIPTVDRIRIGTGQSGNTMCGCIASARYFKKRLTDAKLVTITT
jgi:hypothetical protein